MPCQSSRVFQDEPAHYETFPQHPYKTLEAAAVEVVTHLRRRGGETRYSVLKAQKAKKIGGGQQGTFRARVIPRYVARSPRFSFRIFVRLCCPRVPRISRVCPTI
jgi:hypothetical protein